MDQAFIFAVLSAVIAGLILYHFFGIGKSGDKTSKSPQPSGDISSSAVATGNNNVINNSSVINQVTNVHDQRFEKQEIVSEAPSLIGPSPDAIRKTINDASPYQRESVSKSFTGIKIRTKVKLVNITENNDIFSLLMMDERYAGAISCDVKAMDYPRLKITGNDEFFYVEGKISSIYSEIIKLIDAKLIFVDRV